MFFIHPNQPTSSIHSPKFDRLVWLEHKTFCAHHAEEEHTHTYIHLPRNIHAHAKLTSIPLLIVAITHTANTHQHNVHQQQQQQQRWRQYVRLTFIHTLTMSYGLMRMCVRVFFLLLLWLTRTDYTRKCKGTNERMRRK